MKSGRASVDLWPNQMEFLVLHRKELLVGALIFVLIFVYIALKETRRKKKKKSSRSPPEPAGAWPLIGHMHLIASEQLPHKTLAAMADKYGPIFSLRLGAHRAFVVSNWEVAKECFTVHDRIFCTRPKSMAVQNMGLGDAILGFAPYGPYWRDMRKLAISHLLSVRRLELLKHVRDSETGAFIQGLYKQWVEKGAPISVEMREALGDLAMNIILRMIAGKRFAGADPESRRYQTVLIDFSRILGSFFISDAVPALRWLDVINGNIGEMKKTAKELEYFLGNLVRDHRQKKLAGPIEEQQKDFIDVMLSVMDDAQSSPKEVDTAIKGTCLALITGGNDSTIVTLTWALSLLLNNGHELKKIQDELDFHVGNHRPVDESDMQKLAYLQAVVKETLRLYPAAPLSGPREALEDCTISGYHFPKGTQLFLNLWKLHRDPNVWRNPSEFIPGRFLQEHATVDYKGHDFEYLPFGSGRRMCPGSSFALLTIHLALARLLHAFDIRTVSDAAVDMTEGPGLICPKATPLEVLLTPRPPAVLYKM